MPVSMTGYGRFEINEENWSLVWEIKSVNGRFLDVKWRLPAHLRALEPDWEKEVRRRASRGRIEIGLNLDVRRPDLLGMRLNQAQAKAMLDQLELLSKKYGHVFTPDFNRLMFISSLWREDSALADSGLVESLSQGLGQALDDWQASRLAEGRALAGDMLERLARLKGLAKDIGARAPEVVSRKTEALRQRIRENLEAAGAAYSEERMLQEVALLTDRLDVSEELTRLCVHLDRLAEALAQDNEAGKRLDFLLQEAFREINTCGNKAQDSELSGLAVDFKVELEKCREQAQNLE
ncbi:MAG: YicC family protein [Desulfovibrionaceae bacterium]|nr:YicC family protein [Desulfovibrionaceae bacterium]